MQSVNLRCLGERKPCIGMFNGEKTFMEKPAFKKVLHDLKAHYSIMII